jgi:Trk K+ transport system NAD-binding subunit
MDDATIFSFTVPDGVSGVTLAVLADHLRRHHDAILIAFQDDGGVPIINASPSHEAGPGDRLYVISDRRLHADAIEWTKLRSVA